MRAPLASEGQSRVTSSPDDPFEAVRRNAAGAGPEASPPPRPAARDLGDLIWPVPADAPPRLESHRAHGRAAVQWPYVDASGAVLGYVARFEDDAGKKTAVLPQTLWRKGDRLAWAWKGFPEPRPIYGLDRLAGRPFAPVLVVEGEKKADAASVRFPEYVVIGWPGGAKATRKIDWSPLAGRDVVVWPDADEPGRVAAKDVGRLASAAGARAVGVVDPPRFLPEGWDLADAWEAGLGQAEADALISEARAAAQPGGVEWPWGFRMDAEGLWYDQVPPGGGKPSPTRISAPFEVVGEARDPDGGGWAVVIRFKDRDGREKMVPVSRARLAGGGAEVRAELADAGLIVSPARGKADKFTIALAEVAAVQRLSLVSATGWCGRRFVLPKEVIGPAGGERVIFAKGAEDGLHYRKAGSLPAWREAVAARAQGNDLLTFALSLAFLGPLLRPLDLEGGGVHFRGNSSSGKTTLAYAAGSVWGGGGPLGFGQTWRSTANALEMVAYGHNDGLVVFDELALVAPEEAGSAAYSLASGQSKARSRADGSLRRRSEWRVAILSTGEIGLADHIRAGKRGERPMAGQELRLMDLAADAGAKMGVWQALHGAAGPAALSDEIKAACARDYGHAGPAFLDAFIARREDAQAKAKLLLATFLKSVAQEGDTGQAQRGAVRFGAIAVAGELAALFGVVPWAPGAAAEAARRLYRRWAASFGRDRTHESTEILRRMRGVIESEAAAFAPLSDESAKEEWPTVAGRDEQARGLKSYGYRRVRGPTVEYWFNDVGWAYVFAGMNLRDAAKVLSEAGFLERGEGDHWKKKQSVRGKKLRFWTVKGEILEADLGD